MARVARDDDRPRGAERRSDDRRADRELDVGGRTTAASRPGRARDGEDGSRRAPVGAARRSPARIPAPEAAKAGLRQIVELTAKEPEGVTIVQPAEDGWRVGVEVVVQRRIPSSADLLALYEAELDPEGALMSYRRTRRYSRGRGGDDGDA